MDIIDRAQELAERHVADSLARALDRREDDQPLVINNRWCCIDCRRPIPERRLLANPGAVRCVKCQEEHDRRLANGG